MSDRFTHLIERAAQQAGHGTAPSLAALLTPPPVLGAPSTPPPPEPATPAHLVDQATMERAGLLSGRGKRTRHSEEMRVLQSELLSHMASAAPVRAANVVMVTSARPGEGKTFTALNLAASLAHNGGRDVLLVDTDTKAGNVTNLLGLSDLPGLLDLARSGGATLPGLTHPTAIGRLTIMPSGVPEQAGAELHATVAPASVIETLQAKFPNHVIVLDVAACLASSDAATLAPFVGHALLVVEAQQTQRAELQAVVDLLHACPNVMLSLNKTQLASNASFGGYYE